MIGEVKFMDRLDRYKLNYLKRKFNNHPELIYTDWYKVRKEFGLLTRLLFNDVLPNVCEFCGSTNKLEIHHVRYGMPLERKDLLRLCYVCHKNLHKKDFGIQLLKALPI